MKQVLIESRIVNATDDFQKQLGVRFGVTNIDDDFDGRDGNIGVVSGDLNATTDAINGDDLELDERLNVNLPVAGAAGSIGLALAKLP